MVVSIATAGAAMLVVLMAAIAEHQAGAFSVVQFSPRRHSLHLNAKPPPISTVDLDAIEAFEAQLLREEKELQEKLISDSGVGVSRGGADEEEEDDDSMQDIRTFEIPPSLNNKRIDAALVALVNAEAENSGSEFSNADKWSRSACGALVADGYVQVVSKDGKSTQVMDRKSYKVSKGESLRVDMNGGRDDVPTEIEPQDLPLDILYEDEHMIVLNKAAGMVVHPSTGHWDGTVVHALAYHLLHRTDHGAGEFLETNGEVADDDSEDGAQMIESNPMLRLRPGIVHRLDKGTTGVLVVAKTHQALATLSKSFHDRTVRKTYLCVAVGNPGSRVTIDNRIGRHPINRQRMRVIPNAKSSDPRQRRKIAINPEAANAGRRAVSYVDTLAFAHDRKLSVVQVRIATGRTHQIRVHLQDRRTPIYGDEVYGLKDWNQRLERSHGITHPLLHAYQLELQHPVTGEAMKFTAPLAADMKSISQSLWNSAQQQQTEKLETPEFLK